MARVTIFQPYNFKVGEKITITEGKRKGDWLGGGVAEKDVTLRCPISLKEFTWPHFCYHVEEKEQEWPQSS